MTRHSVWTMDIEQVNVMSSHPVLSLSLEEVRKALHSIDCRKGRGPDNAHPIVLKKCADSLAPLLTALFNKSLSSGVFPAKWKTSYMLPISKAGSRRNIENYRGVTILPTIGKLFESIVYEKLYHRLSPSISSSQHGFMRKRSCASNFTQFVSDGVEAIEEGKQIDTLFTDFKKAFDRLDQALLIRKLFNTNLGRIMIKWLYSYLTERRTFVKIGTSRSGLFAVKSGVPQGSHLGSLLFLTFINDITSVIAFATALLFADDLKIYLTISNYESVRSFQRDIDAVYDWCIQNCLDLNIAKCKVMSFTRRHDPLLVTYSLGLQEL